MDRKAFWVIITGMTLMLLGSILQFIGMMIR